MKRLKEEYNIIVAGGGIAGISAAVKAARHCKNVLLIEHYGFVGGMSTAGMVSPFMKYAINDVPLVRGVFEEIEMKMIENNGMISNGFYGSAFRVAAFELLNETKVDILFHAEIIGVHKEENKISSVEVMIGGKKINLHASVFIDTTGDAQLLYLGNFPWAKGDEQNGNLQTMTLFFRMANINIDAIKNYAVQNKHDFFDWLIYDFEKDKIISVAGFFSFVNKAIQEKRLPEEIGYIFFTTLPGSGEASFNTSNILSLDASFSSQLTKAELIGRRQVKQVVALLQSDIPGFENSTLLETAVQVGVRETRRAVGDYIITGEDVRHANKFNDAIARACYGVDIHGQKNESSKMEYLRDGEYYEIPMSALFVSGCDNLLAAGRCISSTREGHSALRIQPTSAATGEACGAVAALSINDNCNIRSANYEDVKKIISYNLSEIK